MILINSKHMSHEKLWINSLFAFRICIPWVNSSSAMRRVNTKAMMKLLMNFQKDLEIKCRKSRKQKTLRKSTQFSHETRYKAKKDMENISYIKFLSSCFFLPLGRSTWDARERCIFCWIVECNKNSRNFNNAWMLASERMENWDT